MNSMQIDDRLEEREKCLCCFDDVRITIMIHQATCSEKLILAIRFISFLLLSIRFGVNLKDVYLSPFVILKFLTHFGLLFTILFYVLLWWDLALNQCSEEPHCLKIRKIIVILFQVAICLEIPITAMYWWDVFNDDNTYTTLQIIENIGNHGLPLLCLLLDEFFNLFPVQAKDLIIIFISAIIYLLINIVYTLKTAPIYINFDWVSVKSYLYAMLSLLLVGVTHCMGQILWCKSKQHKVRQLENAQQQVRQNIQN